MISKELLGKVLDDEEIKEWIYETKIEDNIVSFCGGHREISIYELSYKCKKWAYNLGFMYWYEKNRIFIKHLYDDKIENCIGNLKIKKYFDIEVDIKACDWLIEYINKKDEIKDENVTHKDDYTICHDTECDVIYNLLMYAYNKKIYKKDLIRVSPVLFLVKDKEKEIYKFLKDYNC